VEKREEKRPQLEVTGYIASKKRTTPADDRLVSSF
jgi:hypothetical protein